MLDDVRIVQGRKMIKIVYSEGENMSEITLVWFGFFYLGIGNFLKWLCDITYTFYPTSMSECILFTE
jgi:hypothetical protein